MARELIRRRLPIFGVISILTVLALWPGRVLAAHDLSQSCYICHNIEAGTTWSGSNSIWSGKDIGMSSYSRPITCDVCHVDHLLMFDNTAAGGVVEVSAHPVALIDCTAMASYFGYGKNVACLNCHSGNTVTSFSPDLSPDVSPQDNVTNSATDGYPNHDVASPNNQISIGFDPPHLSLSTSVYNSYDNNPATSPADSDSKYALCFSCHNTTSTSVSRASGKTIKSDYESGGHYFRSAGSYGGSSWSAGDRMPCSDCHASHRSENSSRLMWPKLSSGSWAGVEYNSASNPDNASLRAMCVACHDQAAGTPKVRGVEPPAPPTTVSAHPGSASPTTPSCAACHPVHNPKVSSDCLGCHKSGTGKGGRYEYVGMLFKGTGFPVPTIPANTVDASKRPWSWSQHGNSLTAGADYKGSYNSKADNFCFKCHGDRHANGADNALINPDPGDAGDLYVPGLSLRADSQLNANRFCLGCHDGDGAAVDVQLGGVNPPKVDRTRWTDAGHGKASAPYTPSNNPAANLKCIDCHEVHGSNHANLLPADNTAVPPSSPDFRMPSGFAEMKFRSGSLQASALDFRDYTDPAVVTGFDNNWKWNRGYGTVGDPGDQYGASGATTGLCDACHRDDPSVGLTLNKAHTHMGIAGQGDPASQMSFIRDCAECHNPHGSQAQPNIYMIADNVVFRPTGVNATRAITFTSLTGTNSFDDNSDAGGSNAGDLCTVCHENTGSLTVGHNYYTSTANPDHKSGLNCATCHPHGATADPTKVGFPQAACNSCHGWSDADGMPSYNDTNSNYDTDSNNVIGTRGSDNTVHKIHVNYLVAKRGVARASSCYVCHKGGGSNEGTHPANPDNTSYQLPNLRPAAIPHLQVALDNGGAGSVLNVWNGVGAGPTYNGTRGLAASEANGWKTCSNTKCHYALSPSWSGKEQITAPPGTMTVSTPDALPSGGPLNAGSTNNVVDKIVLQTDATGMVTDNQFKVRLKAGSTAQSADIAKVAFWEDVDNDNTVSPGDVQIGGSAVFNATDNGYIVGPISYSVPASTTKRILVAVDIAAGAVNGRTMTFSTVNGDIKASYGAITAWTTFDSSQFTVSAPGTLTVSTPDALPASGPVMVGSANNVVDKIRLAASGGYATVTGLKVKELGTAANGTDIASITFWRDVNANGTVEPGTDTVLGGGAAAFNSGDNTYALTGLSWNVPSGTTENILVVDNVAAGATANLTIQTQVVDNTYVTLSAGTIAGTFPIAASGTQTISTGGQVTVTTDAVPAAGEIRGASDNNVVDRITLTASTASAVVSGLWVKEVGSAANGTDIASMSFVDNTGGANTPLGTATFNTGDSTYRLGGLSLTVAVGTPRTILVVANIANGATNALTVQTQMVDATYVTLSAGTVAGTFPLNASNAQTIRALTGLVVTDVSGSATPVDTTTLGTSATHQFYATATYSNAALNQDVTNQSSWERAGTATGSSIDNAANKGLFTSGTTEGADTVTAAFKGQLDTTSVTVQASQPFPSATYLAQADAAGTALATGITTNFSGTAGTPPRWTTAVSTGQVSTLTYTSTTSTSEIVAFTAVYDNVVANGTTITDLQMQGRVRSSNAASRFRLELIALAPNGTVTSLYLSSQLTAPNNAGTVSNVGVGPLTGLNLAVPDGSKLGIRVYFLTSGATACRAYTCDGTAGTATSTWFSIAGTRPPPTLTAVIVTDTQGSTMPVDTTTVNTSATHQFYATAQYSDSTTADVTTQAAWSRSGTATGSTIGASTGLYTAGSTAGTDTVTAVFSGQSDTTTVNVNNAVAFPATTYIVMINSGTALGWGSTNMTAGTAKTTQNDNTLLAKSGGGVSNTYYGATVTTERTAYNAIWNTALAAGSSTTITGVTFNIRVRKANTADRVRLELMYFNPSGGAATTIYDSGLVDPGGTVGTTGLFTHTSPAISVPVPDGMKLGLQVGFQQGSTTAMRVYVETATTGQTTQFTLSGTNSTGVAPAPPRQTGGSTAIACNSCHQFAPNDEDKTTGPSGTPGANGVPDINENTGYANFGQYGYAAAGSHIKHGVRDTGSPLNPTSADGASCVPCHGSVSAYTSDHMNGSIFLNNGAIGFTGGTGTYTPGGGGHNGTCASVNCHYNAPTPAWGTGTTTCTSCHGQGAGKPWPNAGAHNAHFVALGIASLTDAQAPAACDMCHSGYGSGTAFHADDNAYQVKVPDVAGAYLSKGAAGTSFAPASASGKCSNVSCHGGIQTPAWDNANSINGTADSGCRTCHVVDPQSSQAAASRYNAAWSGLHGRAGSVSGENHTAADGSAGDRTDSNLCTHCHGLPTLHFAGLDDTVTDPVDNFVTTYNGTGGSLSAAGCAVTCHSDSNGTTSRWRRKWSATITATDGSECLNCHGLFGAWADNVTHRDDASMRNMHGSKVAAPDYGCNECHGWNSAQYDFSPKWDNTGGAASFHGDEKIQLNANASNVARGTGADAGETGCSGCHPAFDGPPNATPNHSFTTVTRWTFDNSVVDGPYSGCSNCHGNKATQQSWPDNTAVKAYPDSPGAHEKHVVAIAGAGATMSQKNGTCNTCHPYPGKVRQGTVPLETAHSDNVAPVNIADLHQDGRTATATFFQNISGAADPDGSYNNATAKCSNIDCHNGTTTRSWYPDMSSPAWSPSYGVTATGGTGYASVTWNGATDDTGPVTYDLYASTTGTTAAVFGGAPIQTNILGTSAVVARTAGTWYFGVRARDSVTPTPNATSGEGISGGAVVTAAGSACGTSASQSFYGNLAAIDTTADGTQNPTASAATITLDANTWGVQPLVMGTAGLTAANTRYTLTQTGQYVKTMRFYYPVASSICVGPNITAGEVDFRVNATTDRVQMALYDYDPSLLKGNGVLIGQSAPIVPTGSGTTTNSIAYTISFSQSQIRAGHMLVLEFQINGGSTTSGVYRNYFGGTTTGTRTYMTTPIATLIVDSTAPAWSGGISNIQVSDPGTGGKLSVSWNTATDGGSPTTPPVKYELYRSTVSAADVWNNLYQDNLSVTSVLDNGLVNDQTYWYGVRAKDSYATPNRTSNDSETASAAPSAPTSCTVCHGTPPASGAHAKHATPGSNYTDCDKCHGDATRNVTDNYTTSGPVGLHNNGTKNVYMIRGTETNAQWNADNTCSNVDCHYNAANTPNWYTGSTNCTTCHGYPPTTTPAGAVNHDKAGGITVTQFKDAHEDCLGCHGIKSATTDGLGAKVTHANYGDRHADGYITMNGPDAAPGPAAGTEYDNATTGCNYACHGNDAAHQLAPSALRPNENYGDFGLGNCAYCHETGTYSAPVVTLAGAHAGSCDQCHPLHKLKDSTRQVFIPNYTYSGINYVTHTGIYLGGTATKSGGWFGAGPSEAEICWACHAAKAASVGRDLSEWGTNTDTNGTAPDYNSGSVTDYNWFLANWSSANFKYKTGKLNDRPTSTGVVTNGGSTHAANPSGAPWNGPTAPGVDNVGQVRCSYCHDVHDTKTGSPSGRPFLRGTWMGNPYKEDGAPRYDAAGQDRHTYATLQFYGSVPRKCSAATGGTCDNTYGGYQIDQNNFGQGAYLNSTTWAPNNAAGLCELCHGTNHTGTWTAAAIDALNVFGTPATDWVAGANSHKAVVLGATATSNFNLYTEARRHPSTGYPTYNSVTSDGGSNGYPLLSYTHLTSGSRGYGMRSQDSSGFMYQPQVTDPEPYAFQAYGWGATPDDTTNQNAYHRFPCSKCHNPHASRLPRLMITNCLDTKNNTWDDQWAATNNASLSTENNGVRTSQYTSAQNCHRRRDPAYNKTWTGGPALNADGWNNVTPW